MPDAAKQVDPVPTSGDNVKRAPTVNQLAAQKSLHNWEVGERRQNPAYVLLPTLLSARRPSPRLPIPHHKTGKVLVDCLDGGRV